MTRLDSVEIPPQEYNLRFHLFMDKSRFQVLINKINNFYRRFLPTTEPPQRYKCPGPITFFRAYLPINPQLVHIQMPIDFAVGRNAQKHL